MITSMKQINYIILALALAPVAASAADYQTDTFLSQDDYGNNVAADSAYLDEPRGFDTDKDNIYVVDTINNRVEKIDAAGTLTRVAGSGEYGYKNDVAAFAQFAQPQDVAVFGENGEQIFIADTNNNAVRKLENGVVSTLVNGLSAPAGVAIADDTLFISDTGNNRILGIYRGGGTPVEFGKNLNQPTKLLYWPEARSIIFVNFGEGTVRAINVNTGKLSEPLIKDLEDIGGIFLQKRNLFVASSYSIGVFNEIWKVRLSPPNPSGLVTAVRTTRLEHDRETEHLNWPSDILIKNDTLSWEEYYSWEPNLLYTVAAPKPKSQPTCDLKIRAPGQSLWRDRWNITLNSKEKLYRQNYILRSAYQGDQVYFQVRTQYHNAKLSKAKLTKQHQLNQSSSNKSQIFAVTPETSQPQVGATITRLRSSHRLARAATLHWNSVTGASSYRVQLWQNDERLKTFTVTTGHSQRVPKKYLQPNTAFQFRVSACTASGCSDWSAGKTFRTKPAKVKRIAKIVPVRAVRMRPLASGNFLATLQFRLHQPSKHLRAQVELCAKDQTHATTVSSNRIYVLYKGGSAILAWRNDATLPQRFAGEHRFQDRLGDRAEALLGRPKDLVFNHDQTKLYMIVNNKLVVYSFVSGRLEELAGHVMDSYTEGIGDAARFSDPTALAISPDDVWLYVVDRNNHRIRKVNTETGETVYITGAGDSNFAFLSEESNGYQEGGPCLDEFDRGVAGCAYFNRPTGLAISTDGKTLYVAEGSNQRIRAVNVDNGQTSLIAGSGEAGFKNGIGSAAQFNGPYTLDISADGGTLYTADKYNHAIRAINLTTKAVTTVVGQGTQGFRNGYKSTAALAIPEYVEEENGVIYWTEAGTHTVRALFLASGQVITISGNGQRGYVNGPGSSAEWQNPKGFAFRAGKMYVADSTNDVIRTITF